MRTEPHVVIVGAGAAGIGAGLELAARGVPFEILEAADRVGGRALTDRAGLPVAWDHGCHWLHCADENPLVAWADRLGARYLRQKAQTCHYVLWSDGRFASEAELVEADQAIGRAFDIVDQAGAEGRDAPITDVLPDAGRWSPDVHCILGLLAGEDPGRVSAMGYADYADTDSNWPLTTGYGDLIAHMSHGLPVRLGVSVSAIDQRPEGGVRLETSEGGMQVRGAIVTPSTNVLSSGAIRFGPGPAADLLPLIADVPCGAYEKVAFALRALPAELKGKLFGTFTPDGSASMNLQVIAGESPMIIVHMAGDMVRNLLAEGSDAMRQFAEDRLCQALGPDFRDLILGRAVTGWTQNPLILGSYSAARPGAAARRHQMIGTDTGSVAFAGEAFSLKWQATAHGAYQSGRDVAARLATHL